MESEEVEMFFLHLTIDERGKLELKIFARHLGDKKCLPNVPLIIKNSFNLFNFPRPI
jgi:hypothetical protein